MQNDRGQEQRSHFGDFGNFGGFSGSIFERNPFDDPFFTTRPFGSILSQRKNRAGGTPSIFPPAGPVIQELSSDDDDDSNSDEREDEGEEDLKNVRPSKAPFVNHPDDETDDDQKDTNYRADDNRSQGNQPSFKVSTCKVTYGGIDGVYYSSSSTRRMGSDGVIVEECKEADKSKGEATHRISRGLHDKGHSVTRKLNPDGKVDTLQTLHNLNEDELGSFEDAWRSNSGSHLPSWTGLHGSTMGHAPGSLLLPSTQHMGNSTDNKPNNDIRNEPSTGRSRNVVRIPIE